MKGFTVGQKLSSEDVRGLSNWRWSLATPTGWKLSTPDAAEKIVETLEAGGGTLKVTQAGSGFFRLSFNDDLHFTAEAPT